MTHDTSGYRVVFFLKHKSDTFDCFKEYVNLAKNKFESVPKILHVDNGKEYIIEHLKQYTYLVTVSNLKQQDLTPQSNMAESKEIFEP